MNIQSIDIAALAGGQITVGADTLGALASSVDGSLLQPGDAAWG